MGHGTIYRRRISSPRKRLKTLGNRSCGHLGATPEHQSYTRGEADVPGAACPGDRRLNNGVLSSMQKQTQKRLKSLSLASKLIHEQFPLLNGMQGLCFLPSTHYPLRDVDLRQRMRVHFCPQHWLICHLGLCLY